MNEENKRMYPCDKAPARRAYPCDAPKEAENRTYAEERRTAGKGRRGGNSSMSIVIRSEKKRTGDERRDRGAFHGRKPEGGDASQSRRDHFRSGAFHASRKQEGSDAPRSRTSYTRPGAFHGRRPEGTGASRDRMNHSRSGAFRMQKQESFEDFSSPRELSVLDNTAIGCFLDLGDGKKVLLPFAEQVGKPEKGDQVSVYLYQDKGGRLTATMRTPILKTGELGVLKVAEITRIGIFLDNGMPKQLLVPFKEQICTPKPGSRALVYLYQDKSGRQAATMRIYKHLSNEAPYHADDRVEGFVYEINPEIGVFVAVDDRYFGLIPKVEVYEDYQYGQTVSCRVLRVREDGKLDLSAREKSYAAIERDAETVLEEIIRQGGKLPYADKADAKLIEETYHMSKNQFKRALGSLYRERKIAIDRGQDIITLLHKD